MSDIKFIVTTDEAGAIKGFKKLEDAMEDIEKKAKTAGQKLQEMGDKASKLGKNMSMYVTVPILAAGGAAIKMAMDAVESENLFEVSMGGMAKSARRWSVEMRDQFGLNQYEIRQTIGTMNVMLKSMGLSETAAFDMSKGLTQLSYDMASFYNMKPEEAFQKLQAGISGEIEPLKRLGILVNENTTKQWALKTGLIKTGEALTEQRKVLARYGAIMEQTNAAQGDMARTLDSPANKLRILKSRIQESAIEMGTKLLPTFIKGMDIVSKLVEKFSNLSDGKKELILKVVGLTAVMGPVLLVLGKMLTVLPKIATAAQVATTKIQGLKIASSGLAGAAGAVAASLVAGVIISEKIQKNYEKNREACDLLGQANKRLAEDQERLGITTGISAEQLEELKKKYKGNMQAMTMAILSGKEVIEIQKDIGDSGDDAGRGIRKYTTELGKTPAVARAAVRAIGKIKGAAFDVMDVWEQVPGVIQEITPYYNGVALAARDMGNVHLTVLGEIQTKTSEVYKSFGQNITEWAQKNEEKVSEIAGVTMDFLGQINSMNQMNFDNKIASLDIEYEKEKAAIENSKQSEEDKQKAFALLDEKYDAKRKALQIKQAKADKAVALMGAIVNTAQGVTKAIAQGGIAGIILGAIVAGFGAIQIALIAKQPIPKLAEGAIFKRPTMYRGALVGEAGDEVLLPLNKLPQIFNQTMQQSTTNNNYGPRKQTLQVNVQIGTETIRKHIVDSVNWGFKNKMIKVPVGAVG